MADQGNARAQLDASQLTQDEGALSGVEYTIIFVLLAAIAMGTWQTFGPPAQRGTAGITARGATSSASAAGPEATPAASTEASQAAASTAEAARSSAAPSGG